MEYCPRQIEAAFPHLRFEPDLTLCSPRRTMSPDLAAPGLFHGAIRIWNASRRMTRQRKPPPARSETGLQQTCERTARLSDALRDNLLKRKAQQRARAEETRTNEEGDARPSAGDTSAPRAPKSPPG